MSTKLSNQDVLKVVAEWLNDQGKIELNKVTEKESDTETYIKSMSVVNEEQLKVPYNL